MNARIKPSANPKKKIDVLNKSGKFIVSVGATGYSDNPTYLQQGNKAFADNRNKLFKARHKKDIVGSA